MKEYLVIGLYEDNMQRYADTFKASSPEAAEKKAQALALKEEGSALLIAAVLLDGKVVA